MHKTRHSIYRVPPGNISPMGKGDFAVHKAKYLRRAD